MVLRSLLTKCCAIAAIVSSSALPVSQNRAATMQVLLLLLTKRPRTSTSRPKPHPPYTHRETTQVPRQHSSAQHSAPIPKQQKSRHTDKLAKCSSARVLPVILATQESCCRKQHIWHRVTIHTYHPQNFHALLADTQIRPEQLLSEQPTAGGNRHTDSHTR